PAGTAQYHIDADVAFALAKYADVCGDAAYLTTAALPVLVETARLWADLGFFAGSGSFHIHGVTGPDEYTAVVDDNLYTNVMARENLWLAAAAVGSLAATDPDSYQRLAGELGLGADEPATWRAAADAMTIPFDESFGVHGQDDDFFTHRVWDLADQRTRRPLLLHYHPLVIYRYQVLKQADAVLALFMAPDRFTAQNKRADYEYYDPITTGDSTLSAVVQSIIAAEVGYPDRALDQFLHGVYVDLADLHHNTSDGVHIASAGGVWNALVYGFAGLRDAHGELSFDPRLPQEWDRISFRVRLRGGQVGVVLTAGELALTGVDGPGGVVTVRGEPVEVAAGQTVRIALDGQGPRLPAMQGARPYLHGAPAGDDQITLGLPLAVP
ncbi:MAG: glycosyl hydrolase family 65 protein, partial [Propionicimonas sp.]